MPIRQELWRVEVPPKRVTNGVLRSEAMLEEMIVAAPEMLSSEWMIVGRQVRTDYGGRVDLVAIAPDASLVLIELKRDRTPREVVSQAIDYASWLEQMTPEKIESMYRDYSNGKTLGEEFKRRFESDLEEENLNQSHQIVLVASELDHATERIISYLNARDVAVNVLFFQVYDLDGKHLISRSWMIDPAETQANVVQSSEKGAREPWNGEFYVSFGTGQSRTWDDALKYGFISAGGGSWYTQTLKLLQKGDRVWVNSPKNGYLGVGRVVDTVVPAKEFIVETDSGPASALDVLSTGDHLRLQADDPEKSEYIVRVKWLDHVDKLEDAVSEVGFFGNQNSVCQPSSPKWRHTIERLKSRFPKWND